MKCAQFECKYQGYFCDPSDLSMQFCITHRSDHMINVRSMYNQRARCIIILDHVIPVRVVQAGKRNVPSRKVPLSKSSRSIPIKKSQLGSPIRSARIIPVPGAPKKQPRLRYINMSVQVPPLRLDPEDSDNSEDLYQPRMDIYAEIANGTYRPFNWQDHATSIPLIAYIRTPNMF